MPNPRYRKGVDLERRVIRDLTQHGYDCIRAAGSHGAFDVLACKTGQALVINVKWDRARVTPAERQTLTMLAQRHGWTPVIADHTGYYHLQTTGREWIYNHIYPTATLHT